MTRNHMPKLANEINNSALNHQNDSSSEEEKRRADNRVIQITRQIMALKGPNGGMPLLMEIDALVQSIRESKEKEELNNSNSKNKNLLEKQGE